MSILGCFKPVARNVAKVVVPTLTLSFLPAAAQALTDCAIGYQGQAFKILDDERASFSDRGRRLTEEIATMLGSRTEGDTRLVSEKDIDLVAETAKRSQGMPVDKAMALCEGEGHGWPIRYETHERTILVPWRQDEINRLREYYEGPDSDNECKDPINYPKANDQESCETRKRQEEESGNNEQGFLLDQRFLPKEMQGQAEFAVRPRVAPIPAVA